MTYTGTKRKVFISHFAGDINEVDAFIEKFANQEKVFTPLFWEQIITTILLIVLIQIM